MKLQLEHLEIDNRSKYISERMHQGWRLGVITSIDGTQLVTLLLNPDLQSVQCLTTPLQGLNYRSLTPTVPQAHWFERTTRDMFGLMPEGHPRIKHTHLHEVYEDMAPPLNASYANQSPDYSYEFLDVKGEGIYELPVGPIHAGIIEPGHFRFSCYGEIIVNLEIRLGYLHRGVEKRLTEVGWKNTRFIAEATASDMPVANSYANALALESLTATVPALAARNLRDAALEVERIAMHLSDLIGLSGDIGFLAIASSMARLRGVALRMGELLAGNRFMRGLVCAGGVTRTPTAANIAELNKCIGRLKKELEQVLDFYFENQVAIDRMDGIGKVSQKLALDFGLVGVAARASGIEYDCRTSWNADLKNHSLPVSTEKSGDVLGRAKVRVAEIQASLTLLSRLLEQYDKEGPAERSTMPETLVCNSVAAGIVESSRGELIHLVFTDEAGKINRYCIKDASVNNWTGLAIAIRNNLIADFPLCNKSFALSYSGHDL